MEERGEITGADKTHRWIVDPLDGTTNFLHSIPIFAVSIGLEREGELVAGLVYNPVMDELYTAEKGKGAFLNDRRLRVANRRKLDECVVGTGVPYRPSGHDTFIGELSKLMPRTAGIRRCGAAAIDLAWVAAGRFDGFWERNLSAWDVAAGALLVREAGGYVTDLQGKDRFLATGDILAANPIIHKALLPLLR
jgi:myo-inositol-1(or 4)-monophosphatase